MHSMALIPTHPTSLLSLAQPSHVKIRQYFFQKSDDENET